MTTKIVIAFCWTSLTLWGEGGTDLLNKPMKSNIKVTWQK